MVTATIGAMSLIATAPTATSQAAAPPASQRAVRWLALGDSFSSGEGIPGAAAGNPALQGKENCQRANGDGIAAKAYAVVAVEQLQAQQSADLVFERPFFVACTGAITDDAAMQLTEMRSQVPAELARWDVVSMSFGGNNVLFADVIIDCLDAKDPWGLVTNEGCSVSEERLRARVDMLVGRTPSVPGEFAGGVTLPGLYDEVASTVQPGGHVIVTGYPQLFEEPERWASWIQQRSQACQGILRDDVRMLRGVTGYLNEQISVAVQAAGQRWQSSGITFHFVDLASSIYETSASGSDRHGLCASEQWINGITTSITSGDFRTDRSFHPNQAGHTATGRHLAREVRNGFTFEFPSQSTVPDTYPTAECIASELLYVNMTGKRDEIALYQRTLVAAGYDPGDVDGYFGEKTWRAGTQESLDHSPHGDVYVELWLDGGEVLRPAFERLGIACETSSTDAPCLGADEAFNILSLNDVPVDYVDEVWCNAALAEARAVSEPDAFGAAFQYVDGRWNYLASSYDAESICQLLQQEDPNWGC